MVFRPLRPLCRAALRREHGFTLLELIAVLIVLGILSVVQVQGLQRTSADERATADTVRATLDWARDRATASRRVVEIDVQPTQIRFSICAHPSISGRCVVACGASTCAGAFNALTLANGTDTIFAPTGSTFALTPANVVRIGPDGRLHDAGGADVTGVLNFNLINASGSSLINMIHGQSGYVQRTY